MRNVDTEKSNRRERRDSREERNGRKRMKGRGRMHYRPDFSRSRSRSRTPPHWRAEKRKTISLAEYEGTYLQGVLKWNVFFYILWEKSRLKSTFLPYHVKKNHSTLEVDSFKVMLLLSYLASLDNKHCT